MIKNYITDADIKIRYPGIAKQLPSNQADYSLQIRKAYDRLITDMHNMSINPRQCMIPLDMLTNQNGAVANQEVAQIAFTSGSTYYGPSNGGSFQPLVGWGQYGLPYVSGPGQFVQEYYQNVYVNLNQRRLVVKNWGNVTGTVTVSLQGNNTQISPDGSGLPTSTDPNWRDIENSTVTLTSQSAIKEYSSLFDIQYRWYRVKIVPAGTATISAWTVENIFDEPIVNAALVYILRSFAKQEGDEYWLKLKYAEQDYNESLKTIKFMFDLNDDGMMTIDDEEKKPGTTTLVR